MRSIRRPAGRRVALGVAALLADPHLLVGVGPSFIFPTADDGQRMNFQLVVSPVLPSLVKEPIFGGR